MRELDLNDSEHIEFAELHSGVVSPHKGQLNPYYLGYRILEDIEKRRDNPTKEDREKYGRQGGQGREKMFEVRELDNDTSFLRQSGWICWAISSASTSARLFIGHV